MKYLLIGYLLHSLIISEHADKEACEGRAVTLREAKAVVACVQVPMQGLSLTSTTICPYVYADGRRAC